MEISSQKGNDDTSQVRERETLQNSVGTTARTAAKKNKKKKSQRCYAREKNVVTSLDKNSTPRQEPSLPLERPAQSCSFPSEGLGGPSTSVLPTLDHGQASAKVVPPTKKEKRKGQLNLNDSSSRQESPIPVARSVKDSSIPSQVFSRTTATSFPPTTEHGLPPGCDLAPVVNEKKKGRYAKKKAAAKENTFQVAGPSQCPFPPNSVENFKRGVPLRPPFRGTPPKPPANIPAGVQPLNYLTPSPIGRSPAKDKTRKMLKQEKFSPYWPAAEVEAGLNSGTLIKGPIRINPRNYQKAYISQDIDEECKDVLIDGIMDRNRALEGDEVAVKLYEEAKWQVEEGFDGENVIQKTGMVVTILEKKHNRCTVGHLKLVAKTVKNNTPKRNTKKAATPQTNPNTPSSKPHNSSHPQNGNSTPKESSIKMPAPSPLHMVDPEMSHSSSILASCAEHEEALTSSTLQQLEAQREAEDSKQVPQPPETNPEVECPTLSSGIPDECQIPNAQSPPVADEKVSSVGNSDEQAPSQPATEDVPDPSLVETPEQPSVADMEPWKMPKMVLFSPRDARIPRMWVDTSTLPAGTPSDLSPTNCQNYLFLVRIIEWDEQPIATGSLLIYVGEADEVDSETAALLLEHNLDVTPYPENILKLPSLPFQIPQKELEERLDLRKMCIFTIDPPTAKDLDDALSVRQLDDYRLELGVHIADPSFFLEEDSELDIFVRNRATSIYLVQQVFHMLPKDLCMLCSLLPGEDKLAFSLIMEVDMKTWAVTSHKFSRSVICSCAQLAYDHAQAFIDNPNHDWSGEDFPAVHNGYNINDLCQAVNMIRPFAAVLRERRFALSTNEVEEDTVGYSGGALRINQPKLYFKLDEITCMPQEIYVYENKESHRMIEELMLMANILTAHRLYSTYPKHAFLRRHHKPKMKMLNNLAQELTHYGIHLSTSSAGSLNASLRQYGLGYLENELVIRDSFHGSCAAENDSILRQPEGSNKTEKLLDAVFDAHQMPSSSENIEERGLVQEIEKTEKKLDLESCSVPVAAEEASSLALSKSEKDGLCAAVGCLSLGQIENNGKASEQLVREENIGIGDNACVEKESYLQDKEGQVHCQKSRKPVLEREKAVKNKRNNVNSYCKNFVPSPTSMPPNEKELAKARDLVLNHLCAKPMVRADYYCLGAGIEKTANKNMKWKLDDREEEESNEVYTQHYALNIPLYTHFTSPIRRYADIMVHRLLAASLGYAPPPSNDPLAIQKIATNCNSQNYGAKRASEASNELFFRLWIRLQVEEEKKNGMSTVQKTQGSQIAGDSEESRSECGIRETAVVVNAKDYSFDAILIRFGVLVRVYVNKLPASVRSYKKHGTNTISIMWFLPGKNVATRVSPRQDIAMFSVVDVMIYYSYTARRIRAELVSPFAALNGRTK